MIRDHATKTGKRQIIKAFCCVKDIGFYPAPVGGFMPK